MVLIISPERAVVALANYTDEVDAKVVLLVQLRAIFRANGEDLDFTPTYRKQVS